MKTIKCKNCNNQFQGNFCNNCGQSADTHEVNFKYITHEIQHGIIHLDKGILFTIKELFNRPGNSIREYLEGKRVQHFKPLAFLFIVSTFYALLAHFFNHKTSLEDFLTGMNNVSRKVDTDNAFYTSIKWLAGHYAYTNVLLIPVMSLASFIAFRRSKFNYFQHIILNSYIGGQRIFALLLLTPITYFIENQSLKDFYGVLTLIIGVILTIWTYYQFFNNLKSFSKLIRSVFTYILFGVFIILTLFLLLGLSKILK